MIYSDLCNITRFTCLGKLLVVMFHNMVIFVYVKALTFTCCPNENSLECYIGCNMDGNSCVLVSLQNTSKISKWCEALDLTLFLIFGVVISFKVDFFRFSGPLCEYR